MTHHLSIAALLTLAGAAAQAAPVDALAWIRVDHGYTILGGGVPSGVEHRTVIIGTGSDVAAVIDDPEATVVQDETNASPGCIVCLPPIPDTESRVLRENRTDPTQFALARTDRRYLETLDPFALGFFGFAVTQSEESQEALAQVRIGDPPVAAAADAMLRTGYRNDFLNTNSTPVTFLLAGWFDVELIARSNGARGDASATTRLRWNFAGVNDTTLIYAPDPASPWIFEEQEIGSGALSQVDLLIGDTSAGPGFSTDGVAFTAAVSAMGGDGFTEATLSSSHDFLLRLTLPPGQVVADGRDGRTGGRRGLRARLPVPVPASLPLLVGGLATPAFARRRAGRRDAAPACPSPSQEMSMTRGVPDRNAAPAGTGTNTDNRMWSR